MSSVVVKLMWRWICHGLSWIVDGWGLGGLGGGWTPLGSNPIIQFHWHSFIHVFIPASLSDGTSAAGMCASLCLQLLKQYFCKNHLGHMMQLSCHLSYLLTCLFAKFVAQVLLASMQISWWGDLFLMRSRFSSSFFLFFPPSLLSSGSDRFPPPFPIAAGLGVGSFIAKVEGSSMWKEPKRKFEIRAEKSINELLALFQDAAFLQSFSQSWKHELTAKRSFAGIFSSVHSLAFNVDLLFSIILNRALRHWDPTLSLPKKMSFAMVNIFTCLFILLKFIGALISCLFDALILSSVRPLPWVRTI